MANVSRPENWQILRLSLGARLLSVHRGKDGDCYISCSLSWHRAFSRTDFSVWVCFWVVVGGQGWWIWWVVDFYFGDIQKKRIDCKVSLKRANCLSILLLISLAKTNQNLSTVKTITVTIFCKNSTQRGPSVTHCLQISVVTTGVPWHTGPDLQEAWLYKQNFFLAILWNEFPFYVLFMFLFFFLFFFNKAVKPYPTAWACCLSR